MIIYPILVLQEIDNKFTPVSFVYNTLLARLNVRIFSAPSPQRDGRRRVTLKLNCLELQQRQCV